MTSTPGANSIRLLRRKQVEARLGVSRWTLARLAARDPTFPKFRELTPGIQVVVAAELETWLSRRLAAPLATGRNQSHVESPVPLTGE